MILRQSWVTFFVFSFTALKIRGKNEEKEGRRSVEPFAEDDSVRIRPKTEAWVAPGKNQSTILKFLQEPKMGTSWYDPRGPTPTFTADQSNGTTYEARLGSDALINCRVTALEENLVSWIKTDSGIPIALTIGFSAHSAENRFSLDFESPNNYRLRISNVQWTDQGRYLCQLSVHPPKILWADLVVERPIVHLLDADGKPVRDLHYDSGSTIDMLCRIKRPPLHYVAVHWETRYTSDLPKEITKTSSTSSISPESVPVALLNKDVTRGGVKIDTGYEKDLDLLLSRLSLNRAKVKDTGNYTCRLMTWPPGAYSDRHGLADTIAVHVLDSGEENTEAIYSKAGQRMRINPVSLLLSTFFTVLQIIL